MARPTKRDAPSGIDHRRRRVHAFGGVRAREGPVELADGIHQAVQVVDPRSHRGGQLGENARDLVLFLAGRLDEVVVDVDDVLRLDEERLTALRAVVDDAAHAAPRLGPHGQDVSAVAERHVAVGEEPVRLAPLKGALELGGELSAPVPDFAAEALEGRARVIGHGATRVEGPPEALGKLGNMGQGVGDRRHAGTRLAHGSAVGAELRVRVEDRDDLNQLESVEDTAVGATACEHGPDIGEAFQRERPGPGEGQPGLARHLDRRLDLADIRERLCGRRALATHRGQRFVRQERPYRIPFGAGLPGSACLHPSPHSLPARITGVSAYIQERCG